MNWKILGDTPSRVNHTQAENIALLLRLGLGTIFVIGGWWKLSRALDPERADGLVAAYMADTGYINAFFEAYLFAGEGALLTPFSFLVLLSAFELLSGMALLAGLLVRGLSFIYAFLLWSFVIALPVVTAPGAHIDGGSYFSPALLVQIRDVGLSGMFFVLFNLGSGRRSFDLLVFKRGASPDAINWDAYGLLLRLAVAAPFVIGGLFADLDHIKMFAGSPILLLGLGLWLASGHAARTAGATAFAVIAWYCLGKFSIDASIWGNLNAIKREIAYLAACAVLVIYQGGRAYRPADLFTAPINGLIGKPFLSVGPPRRGN